MGLRINTNIAAQYALANLTNTNNKLSESLNRLSTGLRINKAADDSAGMTIADGLKFQSTNLSQAISNGNNGINLIQIADMALQTSIDLVGQIAQKAVQSANDTQDSSSRSALQSDINKLLEEIDNISNTTSYKGTNLLDGSFTNKFLQVGAYANQTLSISAAKTASTAIGKTASITGTETYTNALSGTTNLTYDSTSHLNDINAGLLTINGHDVASDIDQSDTSSQLSAKQMAAAINQIQGETGVTANAVTTKTATASLATGAAIHSGDLKINNVTIGDATGRDGIVNAINAHTGATGVTATIDDNNKLVLTASDGRNIAVQAKGTATVINIADSTTTLTGADLSLASSTIAASHTFYINGASITYDQSSGASALVTAARSALAGTDITVTSAANIASVAFTINNGNDLNTYNASATAGNKSNIKNSSYHGNITLNSDKDITIDGSMPAIGGFDANTYALSGSLSAVDVTSQSGAEKAITTAKSALSDLDKIRSGLGSVQNQIKATVLNITTTQININSAESSIRDVNFAKESSNFSKLQILAQSGTYALSQSNAVQQNVLRLLQ